MSRPAACEAEAISRLCYLAELADARINIVHLSSALGLEAVRAAKARGKVKMDVETCPQYLLLDDSRYLESDFEGAKYVMSPPLRKQHDIEVLRRAVCDGEIDIIATDHCSFNLHGQKDRGIDDFTHIPNGGPGVEHRPGLIMTSFENRLGAQDFARLMSEGPSARKTSIKTLTIRHTRALRSTDVRRTFLSTESWQWLTGSQPARSQAHTSNDSSV